MNTVSNLTKASELLKQAKTYIIKENTWTKGYPAKTVRHSVEPWNPNAQRYCAFGALQKACVEKENLQHLSNKLISDTISESPVFNKAFTYLNKCVPDGEVKELFINSLNSFIYYNDHKYTSHEDILALFDRAIQLAESEGN